MGKSCLLERWRMVGVWEPKWWLLYWKKICQIKDKFFPGYIQKGWLIYIHTIGSGYKWRRGDREKWSWRKWIWGKGILPKHSFFSWLALHGRLLKKDRLWSIGLSQDKKCLICEIEWETVEHLFFECVYSKTCLQNIFQWIDGSWRSYGEDLI